MAEIHVVDLPLGDAVAFLEDEGLGYPSASLLVVRHYYGYRSRGLLLTTGVHGIECILLNILYSSSFFLLLCTTFCRGGQLRRDWWPLCLCWGANGKIKRKKIKQNKKNNRNF